MNKRGDLGGATVVSTTEARSEDSHRVCSGGVNSATALPLAFLLLFFLWPVVSLMSVGLGFGGGIAGQGSPGLERFAELFAEARTWRVIGQTLAQAVTGTVLSLLLGLPAAFVLYRLQFWGAAYCAALPRCRSCCQPWSSALRSPRSLVREPRFCLVRS